VSGVVLQRSGDRVMDLYWRYEIAIRRGQAAIHSITSTSGQIAAVRKDLWRALPAGLICDDLYLTMQVVLGGHRVGFAERATVLDLRQFTRAQHFQRKVRTLTGLFQCIGLMPEVLLPWRNPIWLHFVTHKLMRFATPFLTLLAAGGLAVWLLGRWPRQFGAMVAGVLAGSALLFLVDRARFRRGWDGMAWVLRLQLVPVIALVNGIRGNYDVWQAHAPADTAAVPHA